MDEIIKWTSMLILMGLIFDGIKTIFKALVK